MCAQSPGLRQKMWPKGEMSRLRGTLELSTAVIILCPLLSTPLAQALMGLGTPELGFGRVRPTEPNLDVPLLIDKVHRLLPCPGGDVWVIRVSGSFIYSFIHSFTNICGCPRGTGPYFLCWGNIE